MSAAAMLTRLNRIAPALFRLGAGRLLRHRVLLLVHRGRRTGLVHETVLEVLRFDAPSGEAFVLCGFGRSAQWYRNIVTSAPLEVRMGGTRFVPAWRELGADEGAEELAGYERRNRLVAPLVQHVLGRLAGRPYDPTPEGRRLLVADLPVIAFRPGR